MTPRLGIILPLWIIGIAMPARAQSVEPVVLLQAGRVAACGVRILFDTTTGHPVVEVRLERKGDGADLVIIGGWRGETGSQPAALSELTVATASISSDVLGMSGGSGPDRDFRLIAPAADPRVTTFIQELMVSGAAIRLKWPGAEAVDLRVPGPLPQSTRAAYLNCASDLFRPGE